MERLTEERGERTWRLFRFGWYVNLASFIAALLGALWFLKQVLSGAAENPPSEGATDIMLMTGLFVVAVVLLLGAGISRYQARLEGQHLELKLALNELRTKLDTLSKG